MIGAGADKDPVLNKVERAPVGPGPIRIEGAEGIAAIDAGGAGQEVIIAGMIVGVRRLDKERVGGNIIPARHHSQVIGSVAIDIII